MKAALCLTLALVTGLPAFGQITARRLTRNVAPQPQQPAPAQPVPQYGAPGAGAPARALTPAEIAKAKADKSKNEVKQFEYFKRRAEEGSDHAQYELAIRYFTGKGTDPDEKLGREWLAKSAEQGYTKAQKLQADLGPYTPKPAEKEAAASKDAPAGKAEPAEKAAAPAPKPDSAKAK